MGSDTLLFSCTAVYLDGRMIESTFVARSIYEAKQTMRAWHPEAKVIDGEFLMSLEEYLK